jgi:hypothetical protein
MQFKDHLLVRAMHSSSVLAIPTFCSQQLNCSIQAQLDLRTEHSNIQRFRENFRSDSSVVFPGVFNGMCTDSCLVETWEEGEGLRDFFIRIDRATQKLPPSNQHNCGKLDPQRGQSSAVSPERLSATQIPQQLSTSDRLDLMSSDDIIQLSHELGIVGAKAFLKMLVRDNFVHVSQSAARHSDFTHVCCFHLTIIPRLIYIPVT